MNYHLRSREDGRGKTLRIFTGVAAFYFFILAVNAIFPNIFDRMLVPVARPFWQAENSLLKAVRSGVTFFISKERLAKENDSLKERISELEVEKLSFEPTLKENDELKAALGRGALEAGVLVYVIRSPRFSPYDTLIVDRGESSGIKVGDIATFAGIPVGTVAEAFGKSSKIVLFSTAGEKTPVFAGATSTELLAMGRGGGSFEIAAPRDFPARAGDQVFYPGFENAAFGIIEDIVSDPARATKTILFRSPFNISELMRLIIVKGQ